jgi:hypothetical protein
VEVTIRPAEREHCDHIAANMRQLDAKEVWASSGLTPLGALVSSLAMSCVAWVALEDGEPVAMWGIGQHPDAPKVGVPWFLATDAVNRHPVTMVRAGREMVALMDQLYDHLVQVVHHEQADTSRWLEAIGFQRTDILEDYGIGQDTFYVYTRQCVNLRP